MYMWIYT